MLWLIIVLVIPNPTSAADPNDSSQWNCNAIDGTSVLCNSTQAVFCGEYLPPEVTCEAWGFTQLAGDSLCKPGSGPDGCMTAAEVAASVPELEDYAAAAFLVLALTIGWQVRGRQQMI